MRVNRTVRYFDDIVEDDFNQINSVFSMMGVNLKVQLTVKKLRHCVWNLDIAYIVVVSLESF